MRASCTASSDEETYTDDELEFLKAVGSYRREKKRPFPTAVEYLRIAIEMGYRKPTDHFQADAGILNR
jgi:hypothetical protein